MQEEGASHPVLRQLGGLASPQPAVVAPAVFRLKVLAVWAFLVWERIGIARGLEGPVDGAAGNVPQDNNFTLTGSKAVGGRRSIRRRH